MPIKLIVNGAAGRMGRQVVGVAAAASDFSLVAAVVRPGSASIGLDAGTVAGVRALGVLLTDDVASVLDLGDVVVDVSVAAVSVELARQAAERHRPVVIATTGLSNEQLATVKECSVQTAVLVAANLSVGITLIAQLLPAIVRALGAEYDAEIVESHHHFKDAPSGTALRLAEAIAAGMDRPLAELEKFGRHGIDPRVPGQIGMHSLRLGGIAGEHHVFLASEGEEIEIAHRALSRETFARGAVRAARFLAGKPPGWYHGRRFGKGYSIESFDYQEGALCCEGVRLQDIAHAYGTPAYVYSETSIRNRFRALDEAYSSIPHLICYALKANDNLAIARILRELGAGADVVSGGEAFRAKRAGFPSSLVIFAGVGKSDAEIADAVDQDIMAFNVESAGELSAIARIAEAKGRVARISVRVNPDVDPQTHPYISTGLKRNKFGVAADEVVALYREARNAPFLQPVGIQMHIGSQLLHVQPIIDAVTKLADLVGELRRAGIQLQYLDIGGGLGIQYGSDVPDGPTDLASQILPRLKDLGLMLVCEPGRFIVGNAGILLTRVLYRKENGDKKFVVVDAGMNDLIRPPLYDAYHEVRTVSAPEHGASEREVVDVVGPVCESSDFFARDRELGATSPGDLLAVMSAGAYGFAMASNYNARPRPAEVLVSGNKHRLIRRRETYEDLVRAEEGL